MIDLTLVVVAKNEEDMQEFDEVNLSGISLVRMVNCGRSSLASIGNAYLNEFSSAVFGLCHADMEFGPGSLQAFYDCAVCMPGRFRGDFGGGAVCGACGRTTEYRDAATFPKGDSSYVWSKDWGHPTRRQRAAGYPSDIDDFHRVGPCRVSTLDSSCIFFSTNLGLRFDEQTFDGFHLHGEDICLQAHAKGIPVLVPSANAWHACADTNGPGWGAERDRYKVKLDAKWKGRFPDYVTT